MMDAQGMHTEASSWINTAVNAGAAVAAGAVGIVVDTHDPRWGFVVGAVVASGFLAAAAVALWVYGRSRRFG